MFLSHSLQGLGLVTAGAAVIAFGPCALAQGAPASTAEEDGTGTVSISGFGETLELTIIYGPFNAGETVELSMFLADLETNRPVSNASLRLTLTGPNAEIFLEPVPDPDSPGEYLAEVAIPGEGSYSFLVEAAAEEYFDLFSVDGFTPAASETAVLDVPEGSFWRDNSVFLVLGGFIVVALGSYSLGARERTREKKSADANNVEVTHPS